MPLNMKQFILMLLELSDKHPDGFTIALPDGTLLTVEWLFGIEVEKSKQGLNLSKVFGVCIIGSWGEIVIPLHRMD